ncbi:S-layer homology domain-containing protein [Sporosarcina luteola]|uniref:S-layer homology domain-containing protein n=1 Tax=Sporosarcina luteola TaxID=582850 RepID=UPI00203DF880|nr:S-layer homology domain-containing protein [Sporosarcina luteola]MCM3744112.1 S-layer homology domain-containing protein [Sporosarcina luteola]
MKSNMYKKILATTATSAFVASAIVPAAMAAAPTNFTDVNSNYKEAVDYLLAHNITNGISSTEFGTTQNIKRGDAAVFIARALGLNTDTAKDQGFKDLNNRVKGAVNAIVAEGIASGKTKESFAPDQNITRQEMAKMLVNAYNLTAKTTANFKDVNSNWIGFVSALKDNGITLGKTETTFAPEANLTRGEFALFMFRAENLEDKVTAPEITSISATNPTTATVSFNTKLASLKAADVKVKNASTNSNLVVKSATLSEDKKSAEITFYEPVTANTTYAVEVTSGTTKLSGELAVGSLSVEKIVMEDQTIPANVETELAFKLVDNKGTDVTEQFKSQVKFVSNATISIGKITLAKGTSTTVKAVYEKDGKVVAESNTVTIKAEANTPAKLANWTVSTSTPNFKDNTFKRNTIVYADQKAKLYTEVVDQFGAVLATPTVSFESLTPKVAVVDQMNGDVQVLGAGNAQVKITVKDGDKVAFEEVVSLEVREVPAVNKLSLSQSALALSTNDTAGMEVQATVLDQFGNPIKDQAITVKEKLAQNETAALKITGSGSKTNDEGVLKFNVASATDAKVGSRTVEVTVGTGQSAVTTTLAVEIKKPGVFAKYDVRGLESTLDLNAAAKANSMELDVLSVDATGLMIQAETPTVTVKNAKGETATTVTVDGDKITLGAGAKAGDVYTVDVKVGGVTVKTHTFTVVDTTATAVEPSILFTSSTVNVAAGEDLADAIAKITQLKDASGYSIASVKGASANKAVVSFNGEGTLEKAAAGSTKIYVTSVEITDGQNTKTIKLPSIADLTVNVK